MALIIDHKRKWLKVYSQKVHMVVRKETTKCHIASAYLVCWQCLIIGHAQHTETKEPIVTPAEACATSIGLKAI